METNLVEMVRKLLVKALSQPKIVRARIEMILDLINTVCPEEKKEVK